jgi:phenylacetate-CoA ligase
MSYELTGKKPYHTDCHSGAELGFGDPPLLERMKLASMNRSVLRVNSFSDHDLLSSYNFLKNKRPYLLQAHPSTVSAIADLVRRKGFKPEKLFTVFEPTGETLFEKNVQLIENYLKCRVYNRYGNAEFGVVAHSTSSSSYRSLKVFERAFYVEEVKQSNMIVTCFTNYGFPLIRYDTGDVATVEYEKDGLFLKDILGRQHDIVEIDGKLYPTHFIMDYLDHKVGGVREFQILVSGSNLPTLTIVPEQGADPDRIFKLIKSKWPSGLDVRMIDFSQIIRSGWRQKFRHIVKV